MDILYSLLINKKFDDIIEHIYSKNVLKDMINQEETNSKLNLIDLGNKAKNDKKYHKEFIKRLINYVIRKKSKLKMDEGNKKYIISIANNEILIKLFVLHTYAFLSVFLQYIGIDLEFNIGNIALMQISFYPRKNKYIYIWLTDPNLINDEQRHQIINNIFINQKVFRIVFGADSKDFPYMFGTYLEGNKEWIQNFIQKSIDLRLFCEFIKLMNNFEDKKCSIYDSLLYFKTIDKKKYDQLNMINKQMEPPKTEDALSQPKNWDIRNLTESHIYYALYDVYYLKQLLFDMVKFIKDGKTYFKLNSQIYRLISFDKYDITTIIKDSKQMVDPINNYIIKEKNTTMIKLFNEYVTDINIKYPPLDVNILLNINYFRKSLMILIKRVIYYLVLNSYTVYVNKFYEYRKKITIFELFNTLKSYDFDMLMSLFQQIIDELKKKIQ